MNKKQIRSLFLFLTLLMVTLAITAVSTTDTNESTSVSDNSNTQSVALDEKTGNDYSLEKNNEQMYNYDDSIDTTTKENYDTTSVLTKSITKNNKTVPVKYLTESPDNFFLQDSFDSQPRSPVINKAIVSIIF